MTSVATIKKSLAAEDAQIIERFKSGELSGQDAARARSDLIDSILREVVEACVDGGAPAHIAICAVGGYGRAEMAPFSDVDLLFLVRPKDSTAPGVIEQVLYGLWDLGLKIGHSMRTVADCVALAKTDATIATALLESRLLMGDAALFQSFETRYQSQIIKKQQRWFFTEKLNERDERHERMGNTRFALQPNIKEGKGGFRDLQTLKWIAKFLFGDDSNETFIDQGLYTRSQAQRFRKAEAFLWTLRFAMHSDAGRADEQLTFDRQLSIADRLGYSDRAGQRAVERLMQHYFHTSKIVGDLTAILLSALEEEWRKGSLADWLPQAVPNLFQAKQTFGDFELIGGRLNLIDGALFSRDPISLFKLFHTAQREGVAIHPKALRLVTQNLKRVDRHIMRDRQANELFLEMLSGETNPDENPARILRLMNETGLLGRFIPDFGRIVGLMQFDRYHHYTVDEHTIFAVDNLYRIERGTIAKETPISTEIFPLIKSRRTLYLAVFLHDIAKGRNGAHEVIGEKVARKLGPRFGLSEDQTDFVGWLVRNHLYLSMVFSKRDLDDPRTIEEVAETVGSLEYLRCLHILTAADIRAVGPGVWTGWKTQMMRHLYFQTEEFLRGGLLVEGRERRIEAAKTAVSELLSDWPQAAIDQRLDWSYPHYWLANTPQDIVEQFKLMRDVDQKDAPFELKTSIDLKAGDLKLTVYVNDYPGVFSRVAGGISLGGGSIDSARVHSFKNGRALQLYTIRGSERDHDTLRSLEKRVTSNVNAAIVGKINLDREMAQRREQRGEVRGVLRVPTQVFIDNQISERHSVVEISGSNRTGALYSMTKAITEMGLVINIAKIANYGTRFSNVFYVQTLLGDRIASDDRLNKLRSEITAALKIN